MKTKDELLILRKIVADLHWLARRYADNRASYATGMFNDHTRTLLKLGIKLNPTGDKTIWARDQHGRSCDGLTEEEATPGTPEAEGKWLTKEWKDAHPTKPKKRK